MPKPENFEKLTPDQKRQARLEAWINHEGLEFTNPDAEKGYRERAQMFADAFLMKKPKRVPVAIGGQRIDAEFGELLAHGAGDG